MPIITNSSHIDPCAKHNTNMEEEKQHNKMHFRLSTSVRIFRVARLFFSTIFCIVVTHILKPFIYRSRFQSDAKSKMTMTHNVHINFNKNTIGSKYSLFIFHHHNHCWLYDTSISYCCFTLAPSLGTVARNRYAGNIVVFYCFSLDSFRSETLFRFPVYLRWLMWLLQYCRSTSTRTHKSIWFRSSISVFCGYYGFNAYCCSLALA